MKIKSVLIFLIFCVFTSLNAQVSVEAYPAFEVLAEFDKVRDFTMDNSGKEVYVSIQSATETVSVISKLTKQADSWTVEVASFSGKFKDLEPFLSPNGLRLYFVSNRPLHDSIQQPKDFDIWYVERSNEKSAWGKAKNLGSPINSEGNEFYPALAANGNLYFTSDREGSIGKDDIFFSEWKENEYTVPVALDANVNSEGFEYNAYISKDESYLLFGGYRREDGLGSGDIYISFKDALGNWSKAKPLPANINSPFMDYCPFVNETNQQIYFTSRRDAVPSSALKSISELKGYLNSYQNGSSRIYKATFSKKIK